MITTRLWENATDKDITIPHLGLTIPARERLSISTEFHPAIVVANYPGLTEVTDLSTEDHKAALVTAAKAYQTAKANAPKETMDSVEGGKDE